MEGWTLIPCDSVHCLKVAVETIGFLLASFSLMFAMFMMTLTSCLRDVAKAIREHNHDSNWTDDGGDPFHHGPHSLN
jgi:hypothetical protein